MKTVIFFCYAFIVGTAIPTAFAPIYPAWQTKISGMSIVQWLFYLCALSAFAALLLYWVHRRAIRASLKTSSLYGGTSLFFLALASISLSIANYYRVRDISSPSHILHYVDSSITTRTLLRGTIVQDPDDRGDYTFIDLQPQEIVRFSEQEFEVDLSQPYIEIKTVVDQVVDGDTFEIFASPPAWLVPDTKAGRSVRLIGINAPELTHPHHNPQEYGIEAERGAMEAKNFLKQTVEGRQIILRIPTKEPQDVYGRWLALAYLPQSQKSVNETVLEKKLARIAFLSTEGLVRLKLNPPIKLSGKTGVVRSKIYPSVGDEVYSSLSYGQTVAITSPLLTPKRLSNPAGFDYGKFLLARNIYAMTLPVKKPENIKIVGAEDLNPVITLSLKLKKKMTAAIRETIPYPESAFLGGVTLGLRGGVPDHVKKEFQATGVSHVLAVSGLHVGFVAALLVMLTRIFGLPKKVEFIYVTFGLAVFAIITGASPATLRSVIMFSIGQFFYAFVGLGIRSSTVLTLPVTAFILLLVDPLKLTDGSFVLSFAAIWSLVHISRPVESVFRSTRFVRSLIFFPFFFSLLALTLISIPSTFAQIDFINKIMPFLVEFPLMPEWLPRWTLLLATVWLSGILFYWLVFLLRKIDLIELIYQKQSSVFYGLLIFTCAQMAIQIGMNWPLSAVYFQRFSISGIFINFLAIPLIGFIVEYGLIAASLLTSAKLFIKSDLESFLTYLFSLTETPMGSILVLAVIALPLYPLLSALIKIFKQRNDPLFDYKEELKKCIPPVAVITVWVTATILENQYGFVTQTAMAIQGFNWALCQFFLGLAKNWGSYIPYPYVEGFTPFHLTIYYIGVLIFVFHQNILNAVRKSYYYFQVSGRTKIFFAVVFSCLAVFSLAGAGVWGHIKNKPKKLKVTFFDCGQGNAILIHTPSQKAILIDGGWGNMPSEEAPAPAEQPEAQKKKEVSAGGWNFGESGIASTLSKYEIKAIDLIVNTSPRPGNLSAIPYLVENFPVKELVTPYLPENVLSPEKKMIDYDEWMKVSGLNDVYSVDQQGNTELLDPADRFEPYLKASRTLYEGIFQKEGLKVKTARAGEIIYSETYKGTPLTLTVLHPKGEPKAGEKFYRHGDDPLGTRTIVLKLVYGDFSCLIPTQVSLKAIESLMNRSKEELSADVLLLPKNGHPFWNTEEFIKLVNPKVGILQYGYLPRSQSQWNSNRIKDWYLLTTEKRFNNNGVALYRTDQKGAVIVESDGSDFNEQNDLRWVLKDSVLYPSIDETSLPDESSEKLNVGL